MWPFRKRPDAVDADKSVTERLEDLEDSQKHIERRFTRLQQQVTRWARDYDEFEDEDEDRDEVDELIDRRRNA
jgi:predicted nuclease with TOPRIM domain